MKHCFRRSSADVFNSLQFLFEGMEESGSEGLDELVMSKKDSFLKVDILLFHVFYYLLSFLLHPVFIQNFFLFVLPLSHCSISYE